MERLENIVTSRRSVLRSSVAVGALATIGSVAGQVSSCSNSVSLTQSVIDAIQATVAKGCGFVPNVATLLAILSEFPALNGATTIASALLTTVSDFLCGSFKSGGGVPAALAHQKFEAKLKTGAAVEVHGLVWDSKDSKFVQF